MAIDKFDLATIPTLVKTLDTDETSVVVTVYDRVTRTPISLTPDPALATQYPSGSGSWYWDVAFTTKPTTGTHQYEAFMVGTEFGQRRRILFDWNDNDSAYNGEVYLDTTGIGTAGTAYPNGTNYKPVSNLADAIIIATRIKAKVIRLIGELTLTQSVAGYEIEGVAAKEENIITLGNQDVTGTVFRDVTLTGEQGTGLAYTFGCWLTNITGFNMHAEYAKLYGNFVMETGGEFTCSNGKAQGTSPIMFDMNGASGCGIVEADGLFVFSNLAHSSGFIAVTGNHNTVIMPDVTSGTLVLAGIGAPTIYGTPTTTINQMIPDTFFNASLATYTTIGTSGHSLATAGFSGKVWVDTANGHAGTAYPIGTQFYPAKTLADALTIAAIYGFNKIHIVGSVTLASPVDDYIFEGENNAISSIALNNISSNRCTFRDVELSGQMNSTEVYATGCSLSNVIDFVGTMERCSIIDSIKKKAGSGITGANCNIFATSGVLGTIDFQNSSGSMAMVNFTGWSELKNFNNTAGVLFISGNTVNMTLGTTVQKGTIVLTGGGNLSESTGRTMINVAEFTETNVDGTPGELNIVNQFVPMAIADIYSANHQDTGTLGKVISNTSTFVGTPIALDSGTATIAGMLTKIVDDNGGASFDSTYNSLNKISSGVIAIPTNPMLDNATGSTFTAIPDMAKETTLSSGIISLSDDVTTIKKIETGRWKIENYKMTFYDENGTTPLYVYNLKDDLGNPTMTNPFERVPE